MRGVSLVAVALVGAACTVNTSGGSIDGGLTGIGSGSGSTSSSGGISGGDGGSTCPPYTSTDACGACQLDHCCSEYKTCEADSVCAACVQSATTACSQNAAYAAGVSCFNSNCSAECGSTSSSSSSGSSSGSSSSSSSGGGTCPAAPAGAACGVDPQCGCPTGDKCDIAGSATAACVTAGTAAEGANCSLNTDCAAGLTCLGGVCHAFCPTADVACPGGECVQAGEGQPQDLVCLISCGPAPETCKAGQTCEVATLTATGAFVSDCETPGTVAAGGTCTGNSDCGAGLGCIGMPSTCLQWCQLSPSPTTCTSGAACTGFNTPLVLNGITYGACPD
jgi:hypothetical protein